YNILEMAIRPEENGIITILSNGQVSEYTSSVTSLSIDTQNKLIIVDILTETSADSDTNGVSSIYRTSIEIEEFTLVSNELLFIAMNIQDSLLYIYINGRLKEVRNVDSEIRTNDITSINFDKSYIGRSELSNYNKFKGDIYFIRAHTIDSTSHNSITNGIIWDNYITDQKTLNLWSSEYITDKLILHLDFKDNSNNNPDRDIVLDRSGKGNHGNLINFNYTEDSGYTEYGLQLDGVDDFIEIPYDEDFNFSNTDFSIELVVNTDGYTGGGGISFDYPSTYNEKPFDILNLGAGNIGLPDMWYFTTSDINNEIEVKSFSVPINRNVHIVLTSSVKNMNYNIYVNGEKHMIDPDDRRTPVNLKEVRESLLLGKVWKDKNGDT